MLCFTSTLNPAPPAAPSPFHQPHRHFHPSCIVHTSAPLVTLSKPSLAGPDGGPSLHCTALHSSQPLRARDVQPGMSPGAPPRFALAWDAARLGWAWRWRW